MKGFIAAVFGILIMTGSISFNGSFQNVDFVRQVCSSNNEASVILFDAIEIAHPLGKNTCGDLHSIYVGDSVDPLVKS